MSRALRNGSAPSSSSARRRVASAGPATLRPSIFSTRSIRSSSLGEVLADEPAVAQHRDAVADLVHLVEEVRDEQDRDAALLELADDAEELGHLVEVEARGRLVEHEHLARRPRSPARSRRAAAPRASACRGSMRGRCRCPRSASTSRASAAHPPPVDHAEPARLATERDVLGHRDVRQQVDLLVDRADARALRIVRRREAHRLAVEPQLALVERERAGDRLDERRLARAVLAHERVHLAGEHAEVDAVDRGIRPEAHGRPGELEERARPRPSRHYRVRRRAPPCHRADHLTGVDPSGRRSRAARR